MNRRDFLVGVGAAAAIAPIAPIAPINPIASDPWWSGRIWWADDASFLGNRYISTEPVTRFITAFIDDPLSPDLLPVKVSLVADDDDPFEDEEPT
jgi:hypothetical protein